MIKRSRARTWGVGGFERVPVAGEDKKGWTGETRKCLRMCAWLSGLYFQERSLWACGPPLCVVLRDAVSALTHKRGTGKATQTPHASTRTFSSPRRKEVPVDGKGGPWGAWGTKALGL